jgi:C1A family cysteine protease
MISKSKINRMYGWMPSLPDHRVLKYKSHGPVFAAESMPPKIDLRGECPEVYDQGELGSCTANASAGLAEFLMMKEDHKAFVPSRLFIYYNERVLEGTVSTDSGATLSDAINVLSNQGAPPESSWWYDVSKFAQKPNHLVYAAGLNHKITGALHIDNTDINLLKSCLVSGYPFIFGFTAYTSFESAQVAKTGVVPMPGVLEKQLGGHAMMVVGYDDSKQVFITRNSWGAEWGLSGYCLMPYAYLTNSDYASDFWTAHLIG